MSIQIPTTFGGKPIEGAYEELMARKKAEESDKVAAILRRLESFEQSLTNGTPLLVPSPVRVVVLVSLGLGGLCVSSSILRSWLGTPGSLDWGILFAGVVLCGMSLFKQFKVGKEGLSATMKDYVGVLQAARSVIGNLVMRE